MNNDVLQGIVGRRIRVWSGESYWDEGILEAFDDNWLHLRNADGEALFFPIYNIRLVKRAD